MTTQATVIWNATTDTAYVSHNGVRRCDSLTDAIRHAKCINGGTVPQIVTTR